MKIPGDIGWFQNNRGDGLGTVQSSFCLDLASNVGKVRLTRSKRLAYTGSPTNFGEVAAMERFDNNFYVVSENASGDDIWVGANSPFDTLTNDSASSVETSSSATDMLAWNSGLYVSNGTEVWYSTNGTAWTEVGSNVLTAGNGHLLASKNNVLYVADEQYKVKSITSGNTFQGSGSQTLNLNLPGYTIQMLSVGIDQVWVGLSNTDGNGNALIFEWDGTTENTPTARYELNATGLMGGIVKDGVPYVVDSLGRLLVFTGGIFVELARFPLNGGNFRGFNDTGNSGRAIHPRGFAVDGDELLINVANRTDETTSDNFNEFPSGVWAYSDTSGLYHKFAPSYQAKGDTGITNLTDHGQYRCYSAGPMMVYETTRGGGDTVSANGGRVVFAIEYFVDADEAAADTEYGLFTNDTNDNTQKAGWYVSPRIKSADFRDNWEKVYVALSDLETSGDLVEIKYRVKDETPTYASATWTGTDRFNTNTELTNYEQGDEITVVQGKGGGAVAHIRSLTTGSGSEVVLDRDLTGLTMGQTSKVRVERWKKVGKISDIASQGFSIGKSDHWLQVKLYLQWTGKRELYDILIKNTSSLS